jgi:glycerol-3-phosphate dehydrogenase
VLFVVPWLGGWLIGDTDTPWTGPPGDVVANGADVDYLLARVNALLASPLTRDDVCGVTAGLRPLVADGARSDTTRISRRHVVESPAPGLTTIAGGKYTTYRVMAADLIDEVARRIGERRRSETRDVPLLGAGRADLSGQPAGAGRLAGRYGDRVVELAELIRERPDLAAPLEGGAGHLRAEVVHACRFEGALRLEDVLERRTRLALITRDRGLGAAVAAAELMAEVLGWDEDRTRREVHAWRARVAAARAAEAERDDASAVAVHRAALAERAGEPVRR